MLDANFAHDALSYQRSAQCPQRPTRAGEAELARLYLSVPHNGRPHIFCEYQWV
jgi:hypothetical protein